MRIAEVATAAILGLFSIYLMWKSGEPAGWNPNAERFDNIAFIEGEGPGSGFWPFWLAAIMLVCCACTAWNWYRRRTPAFAIRRTIPGRLRAANDAHRRRRLDRPPRDGPSRRILRRDSPVHVLLPAVSGQALAGAVPCDRGRNSGRRLLFLRRGDADHSPEGIPGTSLHSALRVFLLGGSMILQFTETCMRDERHAGRETPG